MATILELFRSMLLYSDMGKFRNLAVVSLAALACSTHGLHAGNYLPKEQPVSVQSPIVLAAVNEGDTRGTVNVLRSAEAECGALPAEYRADCLGQAFRRASNVQPCCDYRNSHRALRSGSRQIKSLVRKNRDRSAPAITRSGRRYVAVKKEVVSEVNRQAAAIVEETQTVLLRSGTGRLKVHYQRIAQAVGSTKKILRS